MNINKLRSLWLPFTRKKDWVNPEEVLLGEVPFLSTTQQFSKASQQAVVNIQITSFITSNYIMKTTNCKTVKLMIHIPYSHHYCHIIIVLPEIVHVISFDHQIYTKCL